MCSSDLCCIFFIEDKYNSIVIMGEPSYNSPDPSNVWRNFELLTQVPHPSGHTAAIRKLLLEFGKKSGVEVFSDKIGNVYFRKPASMGCESKPGVVLQAHMDMVPQKREGVAHIFEKDPIRTIVDGDWLKADGTTLGADNGLGVAAIMSVMEETRLRHGDIEALITVDEETGMYGAFALSPDLLKGRLLFNLDSEKEGEVFVGCAGGADVKATLEYKGEEPDSGMIAYEISLSGLRGGHSGLDIDQGRANSNKLMSRVVRDVVLFCGAHLARWEGGDLRNAIPRECKVVVVISPENRESLLAMVERNQALFQTEYDPIETGISLLAEPAIMPDSVVPEEIQDNLVNALLACFDGVFRQIPFMPDTVETSANLSIVAIDSEKAEFILLVRSSTDSMREFLCNSLGGFFSMAGMGVSIGGIYNAWRPDFGSRTLEQVKNSYRELFNVDPQVKVIHAGLECGVIGMRYPDMDMVSFGPTIESPHSPEERVLIASVERFYNLLIRTLENL